MLGTSFSFSSPSVDESNAVVTPDAVGERRAGGLAGRRASGVALAAGASVVVGLAAWVTFGVLAVTASGASVRVGLLPAWWMPAAVALAVAVAAAVVPGRGRWLGPAFLLLVVLLPWLPVPVPVALLLWGGPLRWWIWSAALAAAVVAVLPATPLAAAGAVLSRPRAGSLAAFALAAAIFGVAAVQVSEVYPSGDEPHYLVIAQSLVLDGDLQIENNHQRGDYHSFFPAKLRPHAVRRALNGQVYSIHAPGLPVVVAPVFAAGGYPAVVLLLILLSALGAMIVWRAAWLLTGSAGAAWFGWGSVALTVPFFYHAFAVYPDALGAMLVAFGVLVIVRLETGAPVGTGRLIALGSALALLPWLHTRHAVAAAVLGGCLVLRLAARRPRLRSLAAFLAVPALSASAWFGFFYAIYGSFNPSAPYGVTPTELSNVLRGLPALFLDQQFGILPNAPVYACALLGIAWLARTRLRLAIEISVLAFAYLAGVSTYQMWWGGFSAPARFAVPVLLALGVPAAVFWARAGRAGRSMAAVALGTSLLVTATLALVQDGRLIFDSRNGFARWLDFVSPLVDLPLALPSFFRGGPGVMFLQSALWIVSLSGAWWLVRLVARRLPSDAFRARARLALVAPLACMGAATLATGLNWQLVGAQPMAPLAAQLQLLRGVGDPALPLGVSLQPLALASPTEVARKLRLARPQGRPDRAPNTLLFLDRFPAGLYRLDPGSVAAARGSGGVRVGRGERPILSWSFGPSDEPPDLSVRLPVAVNALVIEGDDRAAATIPALAVQPVDVMPASARPFDRPARRAITYGSVSVYSFDDDAYLKAKGFSVLTDLDVPFVLAPADRPGGPGGQGHIRLRMRNGDWENLVEMRSGGWSTRLELAAGEAREVEVPLEGGAKGALLQVRSQRAFSALEGDPAETGARYQGVWIEVVGRARRPSH